MDASFLYTETPTGHMHVTGVIIIDAAEPEPFSYDRDYVVLLSDWTDLDAASFTYSGLTASEIRAAPTTMTTETEKGHHPSNKEPFIHDLLPTPLNFRRGSNQRMDNGMDTAIHSLKACLF